MLLLVVSVLQKSISALSYQEEIRRANEKAAQDNPVERITSALEKMLQVSDTQGFLTLNRASHRLTLKDGVFERGSACLTDDALHAVAAVREQLTQFLQENANARILVEGYTDNVPVKSPVIDYRRFCTVYDDNFTLSAARAREARRALIGYLDEETAQRIVVAGYGDSRPLPGVDPADPRNRRVEVQLVLD